MFLTMRTVDVIAARANIGLMKIAGMTVRNRSSMLLEKESHRSFDWHHPWRMRIPFRWPEEAEGVWDSLILSPGGA
jgi:hypothetical protein